MVFDFLKKKLQHLASSVAPEQAPDAPPAPEDLTATYEARRAEAHMRHFVSASTPSAYRVCSSACAIIM